MKKFYLLLALVLMAGVVHAQDESHFSERANLPKAERLDASFPATTILNNNGTGTVNNVPVTYFNGWDAGEKKLFWSGANGGSLEVDIFTANDFSTKLNGRNLMDVFENFVIRAKDTSTWQHYYGRGPQGDITSNSSDNTAVTYAVCFYNGTNLLSKMEFWSGDVKIAPLRALCQTDKATELNEDEINSINRVTIKSNCPNGQVCFEEAYFISAYKNITYTDRDGIDIGNAYIDPSYLICSNRIWVDINDGTNGKPNDRSFKMILAPEIAVDSTYFYRTYKKTENGREVIVYTDDPVYTVYTDVNHQNISTNYPSYDSTTGVPIYNNETLYGPDGNEVYVKSDKAMFYKYPSSASTLSFSLPYMEGIDMSDVTFTALDFDRAADVLSRCIYENRRLDLHRNPTPGGSEYNDYMAKTKDVLVRGLYNSRYNGPFYDENGRNALNMTVRGDVYISDKAIKHVNSIYWQSDRNRFKSQSDYDAYGKGNLEIFCQNMSFTKNTIKARTTRYQLNRSAFHIDGNPYGFGDGNYPVYSSSSNDIVCGDWNKDNFNNWANLSNYSKMKISGTPNAEFTIRYATTLPTSASDWKPDNTLVVKTDAKGEVNVDLKNYDEFYLGVILFKSRDNNVVNNVELFNGVGKEVPLVGSDNTTYNPNNMFHLWNDDGEYGWQYGTIVRWADPYFSYDLEAEPYIEPIWGHKDPELIETGYDTYLSYAYADLTGYKALRVYGTGDYFIYFNLSEGLHGCRITSNGSYAELDLSNFEHFHLNGIYYFGEGHATGITLIENEEVDYVFYGNGSYGEQGKAAIDPSVEKAKDDPTAKVIDVRPRCNNMEARFDDAIFGWVQHLSLPKPANPNVLFIERTDEFEEDADGNHINLLIPSNKYDDMLSPIDEGDWDYFKAGNIKLFDGFSFYAPKKINAKTATFSRTFNTADVVNSICLPFAVSASSNDKYGFYETNVTKKSVIKETKVGILDKQEVDEGDWLLQFEQNKDVAQANTPYLYAVRSKGDVVFYGVADGSTVVIPETPDVKTDGKANMTNYDAATTDEKEGFYLRGVFEPTYMDHILFYAANGTLYRTPYMTVTPFRTIIKSPIEVTDDTSWQTDLNNYFQPSGNVKVVLAFDGDDSSLDINSLVSDGLFAEDEPIYNLAGQRVNTFDKGVYIVGGKKILVK